MGERAQVYFADAAGGVDEAVRQIGDSAGGVEALLKASRDVYLKVNGVDAKPHCHTDPAVVAAAIRYFQAGGARHVYVLEGTTQGNVTRLVLAATGLLRICRETGAIPVCLDETGVSPVWLAGLETFVDLSAFVVERLIERRDENLYVSLPKLKTHSMTQVTLSVKNQFGFVDPPSRIADHNYRLHRKLADLYRVLRPDLVLVDGLVATNHGHYPAEKWAAECLLPTRCLFGGRDPLAVDVVGAAFLGFGPGEVEHLRLAAEFGLGEGNLEQIEIVNPSLFAERRQRATCELLERFPADLTILRGRERCCREGCRRNTETVVETFHADHGGQGGFTILMGKGIDPEAVRRIAGRVHLAGSCAIEEHGAELYRRLGRRRVTASPGCNDLVATLGALGRQMGVSPLGLVPMNPLRALAVLATARLKGSRAQIPPLF